MALIYFLKFVLDEIIPAGLGEIRIKGDANFKLVGIELGRSVLP